jgi:hypothetical protein
MNVAIWKGETPQGIRIEPATLLKGEEIRVPPTILCEIFTALIASKSPTVAETKLFVIILPSERGKFAQNAHR